MTEFAGTVSGQQDWYRISVSSAYKARCVCVCVNDVASLVTWLYALV